MKVKDITINTTDSINLLGINIDKKLTFIDHIRMCKKANNKINALCRIRKWITIEKARNVNNAYILSMVYCMYVLMYGCSAVKRQIT